MRYTHIKSISAPSELIEKSFDLCDFHDDPEPIGSQIRSVNMKSLLRKFNKKKLIYLIFYGSVISSLIY
jgi:hypothetical protein